MKLILPMLVQIGLTFIVAIVTMRTRFAAIARKEVKIGQIALGNEAWPEKVKAASNNFANQFEMPVLFYVLCGLAIHLAETGWLMTGLAWIFVLSRIAHSYVHISSNHVPTRFRVFAIGVLALLLMFVVLALRVLPALF